MTPEQIEITEAFDYWMRDMIRLTPIPANYFNMSSKEIWQMALETAAKATFRHLSTPPASQTYPRWVKASDRLPEVAGKYPCKAGGEYFTKHLSLKYTGDKNIEWLSEDPAPQVENKGIREALLEWVTVEMSWTDSHIKAATRSLNREYHKGALTAFEMVKQKIAELSAPLSTDKK